MPKSNYLKRLARQIQAERGITYMQAREIANARLRTKPILDGLELLEAWRSTWEFATSTTPQVGVALLGFTSLSAVQPSGRTIALVGSAGTGKTSLALSAQAIFGLDTTSPYANAGESGATWHALRALLQRAGTSVVVIDDVASEPLLGRLTMVASNKWEDRARLTREGVVSSPKPVECSAIFTIDATKIDLDHDPGSLHRWRTPLLVEVAAEDHWDADRDRLITKRRTQLHNTVVRHADRNLDRSREQAATMTAEYVAGQTPWEPGTQGQFQVQQVGSLFAGIDLTLKTLGNLLTASEARQAREEARDWLRMLHD